MGFPIGGLRAFGTALERDTTNAVTAMGGRIVGSVRHPLDTSDFSSFLLQAQASKAKVIGLANAGGDTINAIKQASEFGIVAGGQKLAGLLLFISDVHALGLPVANGLNFTETFYWDLNDNTRAFSKHFEDRMKSKAMPTTVQAGVYSSLLHYFKVLDEMGGNVIRLAILALTQFWCRQIMENRLVLLGANRAWRVHTSDA